MNLIGQFGVALLRLHGGSRVRVLTRSYRSGAEGCEWVSDGIGTYTIGPAKGLSRGTKIILELKEDAREFSKADRIRGLSGGILVLFPSRSR